MGKCGVRLGDKCGGRFKAQNEKFEAKTRRGNSKSENNDIVLKTNQKDYEV